MPKKSATVRSGVQRNKPKVQKSFELVRPVSDKPEFAAVEDNELAATNVSAPEAEPIAEVAVEEAKPHVTKRPEVKVRETATSVVSVASTTTTSEAPVANTSTAPKGSAAARLAARRQSNQRNQQRAAISLVTSEHFTYVLKDLRFIAILATIMFAVIIILHFVPGIGF